MYNRSRFIFFLSVGIKIKIMFEFVKKEEAFEEHRADFANRVCQLVYSKCSNDIEKAVKEIEPLYDDFEENVRNIYELINSSIPLFAYYELKKHGADNYGFDEKEYSEALSNAKSACTEYYE